MVTTIVLLVLVVLAVSAGAYYLGHHNGSVKTAVANAATKVDSAVDRITALEQKVEGMAKLGSKPTTPPTA